jgi:hypothetical protein
VSTTNKNTDPTWVNIDGTEVPLTSPPWTSLPAASKNYACVTGDDGGTAGLVGFENGDVTDWKPQGALCEWIGKRRNTFIDHKNYQ